ncbi:MAG: B12-binding domain-containing radical SAM protein [Proteobacteria bacterium]|nr:B12-binding domain-containing radical SAM protein [Pseudomonadota bacterium]
MRVALIASPYPLEEAPAPPLGLCYVASAFLSAGADVRIFDFVVNGYSKEKLAKWMKEFDPQLVGGNSVTMNFPQAADILCDAKDINPDVVTLMGGPHVTFWARQTLDTYPGIDMIILGEGEGTARDLVEHGLDRSAWPRVEGIAFREKGGVHTTHRRPFIQDLDSLPLPARHLLPLSRYRALGFPVSIITSRGCPNRCIFCLGRRMVGHKVRYRDVTKVADEIETLIAMGFSRINVADDLFTANRRRVRALCEEIKRRGMKFAWTAFARVNTVDKSTLEMMVEAGCDCVSFGLETGSPEILKTARKGTTLDKARKAAKLCVETGMMGFGSFIVGLPGETAETLAQTEEFSASLGILFGYHHLAPFPGTTVAEHLEDFDLEILSEDFSLYDANRPVTRTAALSAADQAAFVNKYNDMCDEEWQKKLADYEKGLLGPMDSLRVEGNENLNLMYRVLTDDLVESLGQAASVNGDRAKAASTLAERLIAATGAEPKVVKRVMEGLLKRDLLVLETGSWKWAPNP